MCDGEARTAAVTQRTRSICRDVSRNVRPLPRDGVGWPGMSGAIFGIAVAICRDVSRNVGRGGVMRVTASALGLRTHRDASLRLRPRDTMLTRIVGTFRETSAGYRVTALDVWRGGRITMPPYKKRTHRKRRNGDGCTATPTHRECL